MISNSEQGIIWGESEIEGTVEADQRSMDEAWKILEKLEW